MDKSVKFLKNAIIGNNVGAISRSSKYVVKVVLNQLEDRKYENIVEYGPGDGVLTKELLKILSPSGKLLLVETDENFIKSLEEIRDNRVVIVKASMQEVSSNLRKFIKDPDLIISSVPFSLISKSDREEVVKNSKKFLKTGGQFIIFHQYSLLMSKVLKKYFNKVESFFEPRNFLPCFVIVAKN